MTEVGQSNSPLPASPEIGIRLYDTLTAKVRPLKQRTPGKVSLYACGPTVYDHPHLGHARQAITYDVLRRYLQWQGVDVHHVANVTDIDDKIIQRAQLEGITEAEVASKWEAVYSEVMEALGVLPPHDCPHATDYLAEMVAFVEILVGNGSAYVTDSGVYLRVRQVEGYGALVHRSVDELAEGAGARVAVDTHKEDPLDFALWKFAKPDEPSWPSPWGEGRPGWHIECVAMSLGILGDGFDLHGGGDDLIFPHHTNERAEALAAGRTFAQHWMHNAMLNVGGEKMAKSLGNFRTVQDLLDEHPLNARAFRLLLLQTHYRKTMEVNAGLMGQARSAIERIDGLARRARSVGLNLDALAGTRETGQGNECRSTGPPLDLEALGEARETDDTDVFGGIGRFAKNVEVGELGEVAKTEEASGVVELGEPAKIEVVGELGGATESAFEAFVKAMDNDLGTPEALAVIFETLRRANCAIDDILEGGEPANEGKALEGERAEGEAAEGEAAELVACVAEMVDALGIGFGHQTRTNADAQVEALIEARNAARLARNFAEADRLRDELKHLGIVVEDTPSGTLWHRA